MTVHVRRAHGLCRHGAADFRRRVPPAEPDADHVRAVRHFHGRRRIREFAHRRAPRHAAHLAHARCSLFIGDHRAARRSWPRSGWNSMWTFVALQSRDHGVLQPVGVQLRRHGHGAGRLGRGHRRLAAGLHVDLRRRARRRPDRAAVSTAASCRSRRGALCCGLIALACVLAAERGRLFRRHHGAPSDPGLARLTSLPAARTAR